MCGIIVIIHHDKSPCLSVSPSLSPRPPFPFLAQVGGESFSTAILFATKWLISIPEKPGRLRAPPRVASSYRRTTSARQNDALQQKFEVMAGLGKDGKEVKRDMVLFNGVVSKRGQLNTGFKRRYFVLPTSPRIR